MQYKEGDFGFVSDELWREVHTHDYNAIMNIGERALKLLRKHKPDEAFMMCSMYSDIMNVECSRIDMDTWKKIQSAVYKGHSGASFGCSMRAMEHIAKQGWNHYVAAHTT